MVITVFKTIIQDKNILKTYVQYIEDPNNTTLYKEPIVNNLERQIATMFGSVARGGNAKLIPDFSITDTAVADAMAKALGSEIKDIEAKLRQGKYGEGATSFKDVLTGKSRSEVTVGSSVAPQELLQNLTTTQIQRLNANNGFILFNSIRTKTPALFDQFYNKAKLLQISYKIGTSIQALNAYTPRSNFKIPPFKMRYYATNNTIYLSLNDSFEKKLLAELSDVEPIAAATAEQFAAGLDKAIKQKRYIKRQGEKRSTRIDVLVPTGGSIPVTSAKIINTKTKAKEPARAEEKPQKFISSAQWTYLVQKRLGDSMLSFGEPEPPDIKERSGRFRRSVDVTANYRNKTIQYTYNPLYRSLEHYGYHPELQVERSIRQVAQDLYAREFSIVRRGGLA